MKQVTISKQSSLRAKRSNPEKLQMDCRVAKAPRNDNEQGNALIFILIAIALLGLLTVSLSKSSDDSNDTGSYEQNQIAASEILDYAKSIENAVQSLLARECGENEISFENNTVAGYTNPNSPADKSCHVFDVAGAGITYQEPGPIFSGALQITDVETNRAELLFILENQSNNICDQINRLSDTPVIDEAYSTPALFTGAYNNGNAIGAAGETQGSQSGCFLDTNTTTNVFYYVLLAR